MKTDVFLPKNNEEDLARAAKNLGFNQVIFLYENIRISQKNLQIPGLAVKTAYFAKKIDEIAVAKQHFNLVFGPMERPFFESKRVDCLVAHAKTDRSDLFYQKRGCLDDAMCKLAKEHEITLVFDAGEGFDSTNLGRIIQNARLSRKHKIKTMTSTFASNILDLRNPKDISGFARLIGLS